MTRLEHDDTRDGARDDERDESDELRARRADPRYLRLMEATRAAAQYLKTVIATFDGDWALALASYNAGPGRVMGAMKRSRSTDFWKISASTRYLPRETREYVPMILASMIIAGNPELYGFDVVSAAPLAYETVVVPGAIDLKIIAEWADLGLEELQAESAGRAQESAGG